jgi:predicted nucleic acid-binding protein
MDKVYIETSIVSYASAWPSRDIETAARQQQARDWWATERPKFHLVTSQLTLDEASAGDVDAAVDRLKLLDGLPLVDINSDTEALAAKLLAAHTMPQKAAADALHVAAAALGGVKYLLTLNCKHIANAHELPRIYDVLDREGMGQMLICTPAEFLGGDSDDQETTDT